MGQENSPSRPGQSPLEGHEQLSVLLVDPDEARRDAVVDYAAEERPAMAVRGVPNIEGALDVVPSTGVACVVTEYELPDGDHEDLLARLESAGIEVPVVVFTDEEPGHVSRQVFHSGAADFVQKPPGDDYGFLLDKVRGAIERDVAGSPGGTNRLGEAPAAAQLVALLDASGEVSWQSGSLPGIDTEDPIEGVATALAEGERFREALGRAAAAGEADGWVWPRADQGAIEHRGVPLPALEDVARLSVFRDVTDERQLREEHDTFQQLLDTARDGLYTLDTNGYYRYVNRSMATQLGYEPEEMIGMHASTPLTDESYEEGQAQVQALVVDEERESEVLELTVRTKRGETMPVAIHFAPLYDEDGTYDGLVGVLRDISDRKARERRLEESERRYRALAENLPNGAVAMFDSALRYSLVEGELFERLSLDADDFEGRPIADIHDEPYVEQHLDGFEGVFDGKRTEFEFSHGGRIYRTHLVPIRDDAGRISSGLSLILDVTERREHERELERQNERLNQFASIVSHDLRNPLNVVTGNLDLYRETGDESRLDTVEENLERMDTLIEELLELARGGRTVGDTEPVDLDVLVSECWAGIDTAAATIERADELGTIQADETRLGQLLENLFRNAVQHGSTSPPSQAQEDALEHGDDDVTVTVGSRPDGFYVADDGPGLPADLGEEVLEYGVTRSEEGTGIGLAIVSEVANAHGWEIQLGESDAGGARFDILTTPYVG